MKTVYSPSLSTRERDETDPVSGDELDVDKKKKRRKEEQNSIEQENNNTIIATFQSLHKKNHLVNVAKPRSR